MAKSNMRAQRPRPTPPDSLPPDERPVEGPKGPRTPYPVDHPGIREQPGSEPDYVPGTPEVPPGKI